MTIKNRKSQLNKPKMNPFFKIQSSYSLQLIRNTNKNTRKERLRENSYEAEIVHKRSFTWWIAFQSVNLRKNKVWESDFSRR